MNDPTAPPAPTFDAWAELRQSVHRFVAGRIRDTHAAEDVTQDVMLKVRQRLASLPQIERLEAWVMTIARNAVTDHYRARRQPAGPDALSEIAAPQAEGEAIGELSSCVGSIIDHLDAPSAEALRLVDLEGLDQKALVGRLGISLSGAKSRVQRAREKLAAMLMACCDIERSGSGAVIDYQTTPQSSRYCGDKADRCS